MVINSEGQFQDLGYPKYCHYGSMDVPITEFGLELVENLFVSGPGATRLICHLGNYWSTVR